MKKYPFTFWEWVLKRSPQNAAKPNVQPNPIDSVDNINIPTGTEPFETYIETESILGGPIKIGSEEGTLRGPNGQLIRAHNKISILLGCHHSVAQFQALDQEDRHIRGIDGKCYYCDLEVQELLQKGQITVFDAERLSLVCTDCGKITNSGQLCCPRHYTAVSNPDGTKTYLSPEDAEAQNRKNTANTILSTIALLFRQNSQEIPQENCQEQNND